MTGILLANEFLDMPPGAIIQRERNSPFWLTTTGDGKDGIPGETSSPFTLPLTPANRRRLGFAGTIPVLRQRMFDVRLMDEVYQLSAGRMVMLKTNVNLNNPDAATQEAYLLHNSSYFFKSIEGKKLRDLDMGGDRVFDWDGYTYTGPGFWAHCHDTWKYKSSDDGDYVFFPVENPEYKGYAVMVNRVSWKGANDVRLEEATDGSNTASSPVTSLCPHIYLAYIIRCIFEEHGYTVSGDILNDPDFKQICLISLQGVPWSRTIVVGDTIPPDPFPSVTIRLSQHLPPDETIAEFMVQLCTFLPIGFEIDDNTRSCVIRTLGVRPAKVKDWTLKVEAIAQLPQPDGGKEVKKIGITRMFSDNNPYQTFDPTAYNVQNAVLQAFLDPGSNNYYAFPDWFTVPADLGTNINSYAPTGMTESITSKMTPLPNRPAVVQWDEGGDQTFHLPYIEQEGNWAGKQEQTGWGLRLTFYRGVSFGIYDGFPVHFPQATSHGGINYPPTPALPFGVAQEGGRWSMALDNGTQYDMLHRWWAPWLRVLEEEEGFNGVCHMDLLEYMQLKWSDTMQIQNTNYLVRKIVDIFPYPGWFQFEAVRIKP